ncbi:MAG: glucose-1-phosphate adenylyltransferase [Candidatus Omnitrophica bacterium]|jgi:glucose-1-phosphate adenylyltransferase|nr:glucose-1-phosphate adenylyltransferase [Candidatus Omnitrophota bacterium]MDD5079631.1 glucose-1-phosphate adenylyltransferase [Candidatus Omnitrophota bacterium]
MSGVLCIILGGGRGTRLFPLTKYRAKPAVPIAGKYRLIDVPISNCLNSGFNKIYILTQFNSKSLNNHISRAYKLDSFFGGFVEIIAADQAMDHGDWFQGSADAVRKSFKHFNDPRIKHILILSGDQLYKMDFSKLFNFHLEKKSQITVACNAVDGKDTSELGIMGVDKNQRIKTFVEKPGSAGAIQGMDVRVEGKEKFLASMGIYLFDKSVLEGLLADNRKDDFGKEVIPQAIADKPAHAFIYNGYWKDIGSIESFYQENMAFTDLKPPLDLFDEDWQFYTRPRYLPLSRVIKSEIENSNVAEGAIIERSRITHSIVGLRSRIGADSVIEDSILMGNDYYDMDASGGKANAQPGLGIGKGCVIKKAIVDKNVRIGDNVKIVNDKNVREFENEYCVIRNGIIIVPKNTVMPSGTVI